MDVELRIKHIAQIEREPENEFNIGVHGERAAGVRVKETAVADQMRDFRHFICQVLQVQRKRQRGVRRQVFVKREINAQRRVMIGQTDDLVAVKVGQQIPVIFEVFVQVVQVIFGDDIFGNLLIRRGSIHFMPIAIPR